MQVNANNTNVNYINNNDVFTTLEKFGLNWTVDKKPLYFNSNGQQNGSSFFGIVRSDNNDCFGAMTKQYEVFQNSELVELVHNVADVIGKPIDHGTMFDGGRKVALQLTLEPLTVGDDKVIRKATAINSHDGSTSLRWGTTGITVSCTNQFNALFKDLKNSVKHTKNMRQAVERSLSILEEIEVADRDMFTLFERMANTHASEQLVTNTIAKVSGVAEFSKFANRRVPVSERKYIEEKYSARKLNTAEQIIKSVSEEMSYKGHTLWGLFSGITHFTSHRGGSVNTREKSKLMGSLQRVDQAVFNDLSVLVA